jgi:hypothetical protein
MNGLHGTVDYSARGAAIQAIAARGRALACNVSPQIGVGVQYIGYVALKGLEACIAAEFTQSERLQRLRRIESFAERLHDVRGQSEVAELVFGPAAHHHTVTLGSRWAGVSRVDARRILAICLTAQATRRIGVLDAEETPREASGEICEPDDVSWAAHRPRWPIDHEDSRWRLLRIAPLLAVLHVSAAGCNGPAGLLAEFRAADDAALSWALEKCGPDSLVGALFHTGLCETKLRELSNDPASWASLPAQLQRLLLLFDSLSRDERNSYREIVLGAARAAATAARERVLFSRRGSLEAERHALEDIAQLVRLPSMHADATSTAWA